MARLAAFGRSVERGSLRIRGYWQLGAVVILLCYCQAGIAEQDIRVTAVDVVGYWSLDEATGDMVFDHGPGLNDGEIVTGSPGVSPVRSMGANGSYVKLDGRDDAIEIDLQEPRRITTGGVCFWEAPSFARSEQQGWQQIVLLVNAQGDQLELAHGRPSANCVGPCVWFVWRVCPNQAYHLNCTPHDFLADEWIFWSATWRFEVNTVDLTLYLNGALLGSKTVQVPAVSERTASFCKVSVGHLNGRYRLSGSIDDLVLVQGELPEVVILQAYEKGPGYWAEYVDP